MKLTLDQTRYREKFAHLTNDSTPKWSPNTSNASADHGILEASLPGATFSRQVEPFLRILGQDVAEYVMEYAVRVNSARSVEFLKTFVVLVRQHQTAFIDDAEKQKLNGDDLMDTVRWWGGFYLLSAESTEAAESNTETTPKKTKKTVTTKSVKQPQPVWTPPKALISSRAKRAAARDAQRAEIDRKAAERRAKRAAELASRQPPPPKPTEPKTNNEPAKAVPTTPASPYIAHPETMKRVVERIGSDEKQVTSKMRASYPEFTTTWPNDTIPAESTFSSLDEALYSSLNMHTLVITNLSKD